MIELSVLKFFIKDREEFDKYYTLLASTNMDNEIKLLFSTISGYYEAYPEHKYISKDELCAYFALEFGHVKNKDVILGIIDSIYSLEVSDSLSKDYITKLLEKDYSAKIVNKLLGVLDESKSNVLLSVEDDIAKFKDLTKCTAEGSSLFLDDSFQAIIEEEYNESRYINWRLASLQQYAGPLREGLYHVYARTNIGKTSFIASELTYMARQLAADEDIIYFNNEEAGRRVRLRLLSAMLDKPIDTLIANIQQAEEVYAKYGGNKIKLYDNAYILIEDIHRICNMFKPRIIVVDVADKVMFRGCGNMDGPVRLKELYRKFREVSKLYGCAVITSAQASAEAAGKKWLELTHMDYSKTGKPGELDIAIGIGASTDIGKENMRYLHLNKNKLTGTHEKITTIINPATGRYKDL